MGDYTATQHFYKPDPEELVDVETQLNYNVERADHRVRALVEWLRTDVEVIENSEERETGFKFFKVHSNSLWVAQDNSGDVHFPSSNNDVDSWIDLGSSSGATFVNSYTDDVFDTDDDEDLRRELCYRREFSDGMVYWRGLVNLTDDADQIPLNQNIIIVTGVPTEARPKRNKYFFTHMGVTSQFSVARIMFKTNGEIEINRMGVNQSDPTQRFLSFNDCHYATNEIP